LNNSDYLSAVSYDVEIIYVNVIVR